MPAQPQTPKDAARDALGVVREHGSISAAARHLGISRTTLQRHFHLAQTLWPDEAPTGQARPGWASADPIVLPDDWQRDEPAFEYPAIPDSEPTYEELKAAAKADFTRLHAHKEASKLIRVRVKIEGPYGILLMGDPHLDAAGTDWPLLDKHTQLIKRTPGLFGANVGDITNNWIGRLARLYGEQNMGRKRALKLAEGWLREVRWLWIDPGNHDLWSGADDPIRWITRFSGVHYKWQGSRLELVPPSGEPIVVNSRHDHPGHSMWHPTHGPLKAASMDGFGDDVYSCGHIHNGAYHLHVHPTAKLSHLVRLSAYKVYDSHKDEKGFRDAHLPAGMLLVNPHARTPYGKAVFFADPEEGADQLKFSRARFESGRTSA